MSSSVLRWKKKIEINNKSINTGIDFPIRLFPIVFFNPKCKSKTNRNESNVNPTIETITRPLDKLYILSKYKTENKEPVYTKNNFKKDLIIFIGSSKLN